MYDPVELPSSKLSSLPVADRLYRQMRGNLVPVMMTPLAQMAAQLIRCGQLAAYVTISELTCGLPS